MDTLATWPNTPVLFRQQYGELRGEYDALRKRPPWSLSASEDARKDALARRLRLMENDRWLQ